MTKVTIYTLLGILLLFSVIQLAREKVAARRGVKIVSAQKSVDQMSWREYLNIKQSMSSFDLANGLTMNDLISLSFKRGLSFYYLLACLWLVMGLRLKFKRPLKTGQSGISSHP
jgi:hypothetical protein